jgi:hypothetical protein
MYSREHFIEQFQHEDTDDLLHRYATRMFDLALSFRFQPATRGLLPVGRLSHSLG